MGMSNIDADLGQLISFAKRYAGLGGAVQDQIDGLLEGEGSMNPNAIKLVQQRLGGANEDLDQAIDGYFEKRSDRRDQ